MQGCNKCLENSWSFKFVEGIITATCQHCDNEVSFAAKKTHRTPHKSSRRASHLNPPQTDAYLRQDPGDDGLAPW
jgi:hypothetical protein